MKRIALTLCIVAICAGCDEVPAPRKVARLRPGVSLPATETAHEMRDGQLVVLEVPITDSRGHVEIQRCFVWRERAVSSSSLQCPSDGIDIPPIGDASDAGGQPAY
jgi:hypothetical protein